MKKLTTIAAILAVFVALLILIPSLVSAEGTEELGPANISIASGSGIIAAGTGMNLGGEPGTIEVDVPAGATVKQVLLYWSGRVFDASPDNTLIVNGVEITGTLIGGPAHFESCRDCLKKEFYSYRADITELGLVSPGANTLTVTGMEFNQENNGAGVLVIYDDASAISNIQIRDGIDLAYIRSKEPGQTTVPQTFTFAAQDSERTANLVLFAASVKPRRPNIIRITVAGETRELVNELHSTDGPDWDTLNIPVTIPAGATEVTVQLFSESDGTDRLPASMAWIVATLSVPVESPFICADFSQLPPGAPVEGLGTVHPGLNISTSGNAVAVHEGTPPTAYGAPNGPGTVANNGVGDLAGFYDSQRIHDYVFTFAPGVTAGGFTVKLLDFGDYNPSRATEHQVTLVAYDSNNMEVDRHVLEFTSDGKVNPTSGSAGNLYITGDAVSAQSGQPGNFTFTVSGASIVRVELQFSSNVNPTAASDPNIALAVLCYDDDEPPDPPVGAECVDFSQLPAGASVEGLGTLHPNLNINASGNTIAVHEGVLPAAYGSPNGPGTIVNNGVGALAGFTDIDRIHDYVFTFTPGTTVDFFTVKMLDFGDYNPSRATLHEARLVAYDTNNMIEDVHVLQFTGDAKVNPTSGSAGNLQVSGDATLAQEGQPGNFPFIAAGEGIARIELQFYNNVNPTAASDPYMALAVLCFQTEQTQIP